MKEAAIEGRRYIVCYNPEQAKKDAAGRQAILETLLKKLKQGMKAPSATMDFGDISPPQQEQSRLPRTTLR